MKNRQHAASLTRLLIAMLALISIWVDVSVVANLSATLGTLIWIYMPLVVKWELAIYAKLTKDCNLINEQESK